jgi:hypothetical protein
MADDLDGDTEEAIMTPAPHMSQDIPPPFPDLDEDGHRVEV